MTPTRGFPRLVQRLGCAGLYATAELSALAERWSKRYSATAAADGWGLFLTGFGGIEIQRDDRADVFECDDDALAHVMREAECGSQWHFEALTVHALSKVLS